MAFLPLDKKFHPDFAIPGKKPVTDVGSLVIADDWKGRILQAWMPTHGSRLYDVANNKFLSVPGGNTQAGKQGLVVDTATTSIATRADITSINKQEGCHIVCCSPDVLNTNHYIFDSTGTRQLAFFNGGGELVYYANGTLRVGLSLTGFVSAGDYINIVFEWPSSNIWINGKLFSNGTDSSISGIGTELTLFTRFNDTESLDGKRVFFATVNGPCNGQSLSADPYQVLKPVTQTGYFTAEATGATTVNLTGQSVATSQGTLTVTGAASVTINGQSVTSAQGAPTISTAAGVDVTLTGQVTTSSQGAITVIAGAGVALAGQVVTSAQGSLSVSGQAALTLTGQSITSGQGTLTAGAQIVVNLTGQSITSSQGTIGIISANVITLSGIESLAGQGAITIPGGVWTQQPDATTVWAEQANSTTTWTIQ